jgi:hypothetical protein
MISSSVSFAITDASIRHRPSYSSFELTSMLEAWVDCRTVSDYDEESEESILSSLDTGRNIQRFSSNDPNLRKRLGCCIFQEESRVSRHCLVSAVDEEAKNLDRTSIVGASDNLLLGINAKSARFI